MRSSKSLVFFASALLGSIALVSGCGDDDDGSNPAGKGGSAGSTSGSGGTDAGQGGSTSGTGGNTGGSAGMTGGRGGDAGRGGTASGTGGTGGDGGAGDGGMGTGGDLPGGAGGAGGGDQCGIQVSDVEQALLERLSPLPAVPADTTNQYADNDLARALGQRFFFDKAFSGPLGRTSDLGNTTETGKVACSSCHLGEMMEDHRSMPPQVSIAAGVHTRNAPGIVNSAFYAWTNWAGRFSAQWELPLPVSESGVIMNGNRLAIAHRIALRYKTQYEAIFGALDPELGTTTSTRFPPSGKPKPVTDPPTVDGPWELMQAADRDIVMRVWVNFGKALQAYMRQAVSRNAPFDSWIAGDCDAISDSAQRGALVFVGKGRCTNCHSGKHLSDDGFHNIGVPQGVPPNPDQGRVADAVSLLGAAVSAASTTWSDDAAEGARRRAGLTNPMPESTRGAFRTPSLRGVGETAPYMHSGQFATLEEVVDFYNFGGGTPVTGTRDALLVPLGLSNAEMDDLVAFLRTLTGGQVRSELLLDTSATP